MSNLRRRRTAPAPAPAPRFVQVNSRLFAEDVEELKKRAAAAGLPWHIELRTTLHRAIKNERRDVLVLREDKT